MTNKRLHQLERKVRVNFRLFNKIIYPKDFAIELLEQITSLTIDSIWYYHSRCNTTLYETYFMLRCIRKYSRYYEAQINKNFN